MGDVIISTLDTLSHSQPVWLADTHIPLATATAAPSPLHPQQRQQQQQPNIPERSGSPFSGYHALLHESKEEQQLRLLKYRLRMCEMESTEWRHTLAHEHERIRLISRAKRSLQQQVERQKHANRETQSSRPPLSAAAAARVAAAKAAAGSAGTGGAGG
ncbi:unnamed protein product, partial [Agarophyton chilense]